jgi:L-fuculose-phosphate aldolase
MLLVHERAQLVEFGRRMRGDELTVGTSGNLSIRCGDLVAITPSGTAYETLTPEAICVIDLEGKRVDGRLVPSSEVPMHTLVYQSTDAAAVVHTHPLYASTLSVLVNELPAVHYMIALLGGPVRVAPYAEYGSPELAASAVLMSSRTSFSPMPAISDSLGHLVHIDQVVLAGQSVRGDLIQLAREVQPHPVQ